MKRLFAGFLLLSFIQPCSAAPLDIPGKSALLMDVPTGTVLYAHNENEPLPPASVTKIMTMLLIMEAVDSGKISLSDPVTASETAAEKGGSQVYLKPGETMSAEEMLKCIAVSSANDCACAMAEHIAGSESAFVALMNQKAAALNMKDTHFVNCTGLDDAPEAAQHRTSAKDIALMSRELLGKHSAIHNYTTIWMDSIRNGSFGLSNTNKLIRFYNGATGLKTGFTSGAGYCLSATAKRDGLELIAVVMGCSTAKERAAACKGMLDYGFANYALAAPELPEIMEVPVYLGVSPKVTVSTEEIPPLLIEKQKAAQLHTEIQLSDSVDAPVKQGQTLGEATILTGDETLAVVPLVACQAIPELSLFQIMSSILMGKPLAFSL